MKINIRALTAAAVIGAAYAVLTMLLAPISYGPLQFRVSEALCIMPYFLPCTAWGLFAGCAIANILTGNIFDVIFGSLATLLATLIAAGLGRHSRGFWSRFAACSANVVINAVIIGAVITGAYNGQNIFRHMDVFAMNALYIFLGEAGVMYIIALPLMRYLPEKQFFRDFIEKTNNGRYKE